VQVFYYFLLNFTNSSVQNKVDSFPKRNYLLCCQVTESWHNPHQRINTTSWTWVMRRISLSP